MVQSFSDTLHKYLLFREWRNRNSQRSQLRTVYICLTNLLADDGCDPRAAEWPVDEVRKQRGEVLNHPDAKHVRREGGGVRHAFIDSGLPNEFRAVGAVEKHVPGHKEEVRELRMLRGQVVEG